ncbi:hypothetical protein BDV33DRAFT_105208 [Aspergillus novoparasiticus]|uniref:Uncharacterized protein n=1 Tax=Aspergillus novoparasiticus TaxID=986946 RepID=A0A5N6EQC6_9EURO|nr:hypothetical protein BDV33DRAFT_105208 [Aspergillus novoparasiticus]
MLGEKNADGLDKALFPHERHRGGLWVRRTSRTNAFLVFLAAPPGGMVLRLIWPLLALHAKISLHSESVCGSWTIPVLFLPFSFSFFPSLIFVVINSPLWRICDWQLHTYSEHDARGNAAVKAKTVVDDSGSWNGIFRSLFLN